MGDTTTGLHEDDWSSLVSSVRRGACTLMLGPDAFTADFGGQQLPIAVGLAQFVKERLGNAYADLDPTKPWSVAQVAIAEKDPHIVQNWVTDFYQTADHESQILTDLAALPFSLVVNTSPGLSALHAFQRTKPRTHFAFYQRHGPDNRESFAPTIDEPLIYNLYGSLREPASLILSDTDRVEFLISVIEGNPPLPVTLTSVLTNPDRPFLFLGFNLTQWQLRILLHVLTHKAQRSYKSFALELQTAGPDQETRLFYQMGHRVDFFDMDLQAFVRELRERIEALSPPQDDVTSAHAPPAGAPLVFVCHASEDREFAARLAEHLEANGLRAWLDKESLAAGTRWDPAIEDAIDSGADYFVVLQSRALKEKDKGYVNKEILLALERQKRYRDPRRFIFPVIVDDASSCLPMFRAFQHLDLSPPEGMDDLVKEIKRDLKFDGRFL